MLIKLTKAELKRASKIAREGLIIPSGTRIQELRKWAETLEFVPLAKILTEAKKKELRKTVKRGKQ